MTHFMNSDASVHRWAGHAADGEVLQGDAVVRLPVGTSIAEAEKRLILATLDQNGGNKRKAAAVLGVSVRTIYNRLRDWRVTAAI